MAVRSDVVDIGLCFHRTEPAAEVIPRARQAEILGFDEFWVIEDCFYTSGPSLAAVALASTATIGIGIGILPVVARNPAVTAMEIATIAEIDPGRLHAGLGHGVQEWMGQMNERVGSPLTALEEVLSAVDRLLRGHTVSVAGRYVTLDRVALEAPPSNVPMISAGVRGPKSLAVAGRCADGVILADFVTAEYVNWARQATGRDDHRITVFAELAIAADHHVRDIHKALTPHLASVAATAPTSLTLAPFWDELEADATNHGWENAVRRMPSHWWPMMAGVGSASDVAEYIRTLDEAGVDSVAFFPNPLDAATDVAIAARELAGVLG